MMSLGACFSWEEEVDEGRLGGRDRCAWQGKPTTLHSIYSSVSETNQHSQYYMSSVSSPETR